MFLAVAGTPGWRKAKGKCSKAKGKCCEVKPEWPQSKSLSNASGEPGKRS